MNLGAFVAQVWLEAKPIKRWKAKRAAKKAMTHPEAAASVNGEYFNDEGIRMDIKLFATQAVLGILRHAMTALAPLGIVVTDDWLMQTASIIVGGIGLVWSLRRKAKAATK